ncbi:MAG: hypothetical protein AAGH53_06425 [Pseudomonadota bacterium]
MKLVKTAAIPITLALLLGAAPAAAEGVSNAAEAAAEFDAAVQSGIRASTTSEAEMCAGYWFGLKDLHGAMPDLPFYQQLPQRLSQETASLGHQYWGAVVAQYYEGDNAKLEAAGDRVGGYREEMIKRFIAGQETGKIVGVFDTLGTCTVD